MGHVAHDGFRPTRPGPYFARSASDRTDDWPFWFVESGGLNCMSGPGGAVLTSREVAEGLARAWNGSDATGPVSIVTRKETT